jgi:hypothetical protein
MTGLEAGKVVLRLSLTGPLKGVSYSLQDKDNHAGQSECKLPENVRLEDSSSVDSKADLLNAAKLRVVKP